MTENSPPPAARTPGQSAYEARQAAFATRMDIDPEALPPWDEVSPADQADEEAVAQAAIAAAPAGPENSWAEAFHDDAAEARAEVLRLRERVGELEAANAALVLAGPVERIKAAGPVSACCGAAYERVNEYHGMWKCAGCGQYCSLIGVIA